jgi:hypothetical protein
MSNIHRLHRRTGRGSRGQAIVELALVFPLFVMVFFGIIVLGIGVFYQQQITNAAREAARFASIHSATASQPTVSWLDPAAQPLSYVRYDRPEESWPHMTAAGRKLIFGLNPSNVNIAACWSGYWQNDDPDNFDAPPPLPFPGYDVIGPIVSSFQQCTIDGADPTSDPEDIGCTSSLASTTEDKASNLSEGQGRIVANTVTAYACYIWSPPLAGFLLIPETVTLRAVITEPIQRQQ